MDKISIIIRNRNEQEYIGFAIQSCLDHFDNPEIIVVDNNSTDDSIEIVNLFDQADIRIVKIDDYTPGKAINLGVEHCTNDVILVMSAHAQITEMNYDRVRHLLGSYIAVMGQQNPVYRGKRITKRYVWSHFGDEHVENMYSEIENRQFLHNAFCFYRKDILEEYPMPENHAGKEDRYWAIAMINLYERTYSYNPEFKANHFYTGPGATWKGLG